MAIPIGAPPNMTDANNNDITDSKVLTKIKITACKPVPLGKEEFEDAVGWEQIFKLFSLIRPKTISGKRLREAATNNMPNGIGSGAGSGGQNKGTSLLNTYIEDGAPHIYVYASLDGGISESFSSDYQPHVLASMIQGAKNSGIGSLAKSAKQMGMSSEYIGKQFTGIMEMLGGNLANNPKHRENIKRIKSWGNSKGANNAKDIISQSYDILGSDIDFPKVWSSSSFNSAINLNIRLYNPFPKDDASHYKNIIAPLAILLAFAAPISSLDAGALGSSGAKAAKNNLQTVIYSAPFYCKLDCPGLFYNPFGAISNLTIIKGGDMGSISLINRPVIVDVKLSFVWLHSVITNSSIGGKQSVKEYLSVLSKSRKDEGTESQGGKKEDPISNKPSGISNAKKSPNDIIPNRSGEIKDLPLPQNMSDPNQSATVINFILASSNSDITRAQAQQALNKRADAKAAKNKTVNNNTYKESLSNQTTATNNQEKIDIIVNETVDIPDTTNIETNSEVSIENDTLVFNDVGTPSVRITRPENVT